MFGCCVSIVCSLSLSVLVCWAVNTVTDLSGSYKAVSLVNEVINNYSGILLCPNSLSLSFVLYCKSHLGIRAKILPRRGLPMVQKTIPLSKASLRCRRPSSPHQ